MAGYSSNFYTQLEQSSLISARTLAPIILNKYNPNTIVDFGCGSGAFLSVFLDLGISEILGLEGEWILQAKPLHPRVPIKIHDLETEIDLERRFDLAICLEVAEHLPIEYAKTLVKSLVNASERILFSAAIPGQNGTNHVNLQFPEYWAELFREHEYYLEWDPRPELWKLRGLAPWYKQNLLVFRRKCSTSLVYSIPQRRFHPEIAIEHRSTSYKINLLLRRFIRKSIRILKLNFQNE